METITNNMEEVTSTTDGPDLFKFPIPGQNNYTDLGNNMEMDSNMVGVDVNTVDAIKFDMHYKFYVKTKTIFFFLFLFSMVC